MSKHALHEILAAEPDLATNTKAVTQQIIQTFGKETKFTGTHKSYQVFDEARQNLKLPDEVKKVATTVPYELSWFTKEICGYYDLLASKEVTNQTATADLVVDGVVIAKNLPSLFLLNMENQLKALISVIDSIHVRDSSIEWEEAIDEGRDIYRTKFPTERVQSEVQDHAEVIQAPNEFSNKTEWRSIKTNVPFGKTQLIDYTSLISPIEKAEMISRLQKLRVAVKKARQQANSVEIKEVHGIGEKLLDYIFKGAKVEA